MKNKIRLLSISKNEHRSEYSFPKEQKLFEIIRNILYKLNFENGPNDEIDSIGRHVDDEGFPIKEKEEDIMTKEYNEKIINLESDIYSLDIIFFSKKVILIFNYKEDKQQEISKILEQFILEEEIIK